MEYRSGMSVREYYEKNKDFLHELAQSGDTIVRSMALTILIAAGESTGQQRESKQANGCNFARGNKQA